jgi:hypothetical protein
MEKQKINLQSLVQPILVYITNRIESGDYEVSLISNSKHIVIDGMEVLFMTKFNINTMKDDKHQVYVLGWHVMDLSGQATEDLLNHYKTIDERKERESYEKLKSKYEPNLQLSEV